MKILVLNAGSSSQKSCLYDVSEDPSRSDPLHPIWDGKIDWSHQPGQAELKLSGQGHHLTETLPSDDRAAVMQRLLASLTDGETKVLDHLSDITVVGHRVVHGGQKYRQPTRVTEEVKQAIDQLIALAPSHNPANLQGIQLIEAVLPQTPQVAVFDTAFHSHLPEAAAVYPGPYEWYKQGIRRYGFHGISHEYCANRTAQLVGRDLNEMRILTCHLGNGASLAAVSGGRSVDTTMGFTPLAGLMMGTRSGSVDPGILIHLLRQTGLSVDELDQQLNQHSGLKGLSQQSGDMRRIQQLISEQDPKATLAFEVYCHRLRAEMGSMVASLQGLDAIAFTGGVGEHSPQVRAAACQAFEWLGLALDPELNQQSPMDRDIATADSRIRVVVVRAEEDWAIAKACWSIMAE